METLPVYFGGILAVLLLTSFVKIFTTLNILRYGLGLEGAGTGFIIFGLSLALSLIVSAPQFSSGGGAEALFAGKISFDKSRIEQDFRPFMEANTDPAVTQMLSGAAARISEKNTLQQQAPKSPELNGRLPFNVTVSSFLVSELKSAFLLGLLFIVPFVVLDLIVANSLMALGIVKMSPSVVSLPLKLLLFISVDGWTLVAGKLLGSYLQGGG